MHEEIEDSLPLPGGEKEVPLVICDRIFDEDDSFYYSSIDPSLTEEPHVLASAINGFFGDTILRVIDLLDRLLGGDRHRRALIREASTRYRWEGRLQRRL